MKTTQSVRLLKYLNDFGSITAYEAVKELGILQLSARICEWEKAGVHFSKAWETSVNRYGEKIRFVRYSLDG